MEITIFTPTYNRVDKLPQLYESLCNQQIQNFEWLIIDDGSTDNTEKLISSYITENHIHIRYIKQPNGGKHRAFNRAIEEAKSEWFVCIDSDDYLTPNAINKMMNLGKKVKNRTELAGFVGICVSPANKILGKTPNDYLISDTIEIRDKYKIWGEPEVYKTAILKQFKFPEFDGEKFITEAVVFDQLTNTHKLLYSNIPLMIKEFLVGGLTDNQLQIRVNSINGTLLYYKQRYYLSRKILYKIKAIINYQRFYLHSIRKNQKIIGNFGRIFFLFFPISYLLYIKDLKKLV